MARWFAADPHLGHRKVAELRGFSSVEEHDAAVLDGIASSVHPKNDQLWLLGDLSSGTKSAAAFAMQRLAALGLIIKLIPGNHDPVHPMNRDAHRYMAGYLDVFELVQPFARIKMAGTNVLLSHFPYQGGGDHTDVERHVQWRLPDLGEWLIHGHTHSDQHRSADRSICVSLDAWDLRPVLDDRLERIILSSDTEELR